MADQVRSVDYWYVTVDNKAGEGTKLLTGLKGSGVNLLAFCGFPIDAGRAQLDLVPADAEKFRAAATKLGLKLSDRKKAFLVQGQDRVGACAEVFAKLSGAGINITASQAITGGSNRYGIILWVKPADFDRASKTLGS